MKKYIILHIYVISVLLLNISSFKLFAQQPILPGNDDLDNINEKIRVYTDLAYQCNGFDCPVFDCESAQIVLNNLRDARKYMRYEYFWLSLYTNKQMELLFSLANEGKINSDQIEKMQYIVDMQEATRVCAGAMLDIGGGLANVEEILGDLTKVESMDIWEKLIDLDKLYESSKDLEQSMQAWDDKGEDPLLDIFNLDNEVINDVISHTSDLITIIHETKISGGDIKKAFSDSKSKVALYSLVGRFLKPILENSIKKREIYIRSLINDLNETNFTQSQMFNDLGELQLKRNKVEDAFNALDNLLVIKSGSLSGTLTRCFLKNKNGCPSLNYNYVSTIEIESQYEIFDIRDIDDHKDEYNSLPIGKALKYFTSKLLNEVPNLINNPIDISEPEKPELEISKSNFMPNESFKVRFTAPACYPYRSWVGVVPSEVVSGSEKINGKEQIGSISFLKGKKEGELIFIAPEKEGKYDLRMNNIETGFEVVAVSFEVKAELGQVQMKAFDKDGNEIEYFVRIKQDDKPIKSVDGLGLIESLSPGEYELLFSIYGEKDIERNIEIIKGEITEVVVNLSEENEENIIDLSGNWNIGGRTIHISQNGSSISGKYINLTQRDINYFGYNVNELTIIGKFDGKTFKGVYYLKNGISFKKKCPEKWNLPVELNLTLSNDGNRLLGTRKDHLISYYCDIQDRGWEKMDYIRVPNSNLKVDLSKEEEHPVPPGWVRGTLYNSNDGNCSVKGKFIIFYNVYEKFKNLNTGEVSQYMVVAPGENLEVATPGGNASIFIRVYNSNSRPKDPSTISKNSFSFYSASQLSNGWWYTAGCTDGTQPASRCDNGNGRGYSNSNSKCPTAYAEEH